MFTLIDAVPVLVIRYKVDVVRAASKLYDAFRKLTDNNRYKLVLVLGNNHAYTPSLAVEFIESSGSDIKIEPLSSDANIRVIKIFCGDDVTQAAMDEVAEYIYSNTYWRDNPYGYQRR